MLRRANPQSLLASSTRDGGREYMEDREVHLSEPQPSAVATIHQVGLPAERSGCLF